MRCKKCSILESDIMKLEQKIKHMRQYVDVDLLGLKEVTQNLIRVLREKEMIGDALPLSESWRLKVEEKSFMLNVREAHDI